MTQPTRVAEPEPCTTIAAKKRHLSRNLTPPRNGSPGRYGRTLCGLAGRDETRANFESRGPFRHGQPLVLADLPLCKVCDRSAQTAGRNP
jgi:hypothetical protein